MNPNNSVVSSVIKNYKYTQNAFLPKELDISLSQESDLKYRSVVKTGDKVKEGDIIARVTDSSDVTSYIHSSVPGTVMDIAPCFSPDGKQDFAIKIKFGGSFNYLGKKTKETDTEYLTSSTIIQNLLDKGVINTFYTSKPVNLGSQIKQNNEFKNLIVRLYDEDPYRITDSLITKFYHKEIIKGAEVLAKAINASGIIFAIDQKFEHKEFFDEVNMANFRLLEMNIKKYPCGTPREITSAFKRSGMKKACNFEITKKDLFTDASTVYEVYKAGVCSIPSISKMVHFSGNCLYSSCLLDVRIGTPIKDIVSQIGGFSKQPAKIVINGSICGTSVQSMNVPITKYVKSVEFISNHKITDTQIYSCVNCGNCRFICPVKISPDILYNNTVNFKFLPENFAASSMACIECGLCNTVCPSRLPLSQTITYIKENLKN